MIVVKTKSLAEKALKLFLGRSEEITAESVKPAREYIANYWKELERFHPKDDKTLVGLPHPYLVPTNNQRKTEGTDQIFNFNEMYYWDSYFMAQCMMDQQNAEFVKGEVENLLTLEQRFQVIPNASRTYFTGHSQSPLLSSFIMQVYELNQDKIWLEKAMAIAKEEYANVWMGTEQPHWRQVHKGLSRYYDINVLHDLAEAESGWDMTTRFYRKALDYVPADLNALLYKYETDFAKTSEILGNQVQAEEWKAKSQARKEVMNELMWSKTFGLYYDYNFKKKKRGNVASLAAYYPMWVGMADREQAAQLVKSLRKFEYKGGLVTTDGKQLSQRIFTNMPVQWAYPNGWAPLHLIVVEALLRYGYHDDAERIARKWLRTNLDWYNAHGTFLEKYNVVNPKDPPNDGVYPTPSGFGWTNAVFERLCQLFIDQ